MLKKELFMTILPFFNLKWLFWQYELIYLISILVNIIKKNCDLLQLGIMQTIQSNYENWFCIHNSYICGNTIGKLEKIRAGRCGIKDIKVYKLQYGG